MRTAANMAKWPGAGALPGQEVLPAGLIL